MHKASAYQALAKELERWRSMPRGELVAAVGKRVSACSANVDGEEIAVEVEVHWHGDNRTAVRISGAANGPSHWRLERLEESVVVSLVS
jgi:hypothetical protein